MTRQLLVPLKGGDRVEDILPYVREVAQPETTVVFLVNFGANRFEELSAQLLVMNTGLSAKLYGGAGSDRQSNIEQSIQEAADKLRERGVAIKVKFYTGSLRRLVRQCMENEPVKCVLMRPARSRILRWYHAFAAAVCGAGPSPRARVFLLFDPTASLGGEHNDSI
jgi:hypothetical protein